VKILLTPVRVKAKSQQIP